MLTGRGQDSGQSSHDVVLPALAVKHSITYSVLMLNISSASVFPVSIKSLFLLINYELVFVSQASSPSF